MNQGVLTLADRIVSGPGAMFFVTTLSVFKCICFILLGMPRRMKLQKRDQKSLSKPRNGIIMVQCMSGNGCLRRRSPKQLDDRSSFAAPWGHPVPDITNELDTLLTCFCPKSVNCQFSKNPLYVFVHFLKNRVYIP